MARPKNPNLNWSYADLIDLPVGTWVTVHLDRYRGARSVRVTGTTVADGSHVLIENEAHGLVRIADWNFRNFELTPGPYRAGTFARVGLERVIVEWSTPDGKVGCRYADDRIETHPFEEVLAVDDDIVYPAGARARAHTPREAYSRSETVS